MFIASAADVEAHDAAADESAISSQLGAARRYGEKCKQQNGHSEDVIS